MNRKPSTALSELCHGAWESGGCSHRAGSQDSMRYLLAQDSDAFSDMCDQLIDERAYHIMNVQLVIYLRWEDQTDSLPHLVDG